MARRAFLITNTLGRTAGAALAVGGVLTAIVAVNEAVAMLRLLREAAATGQLAIALGNVGLALVFTLLSAAAIATGAQLVRERPYKRWLLWAALAPQFVSIVVSGLQYRFTPAGFIGLAIYSLGTNLRIGLEVHTGSQVLLGFDSFDAWSVQINLVAIVVGAALWRRGRSGEALEPPADAPGAPRPPARSLRLLLVENYPAFTSVVVPTFLFAHEVTVATSCAAARTAFATATFDVVLVDYDLEDGKGDSLVPWLVERGAPVVAISSHEEGNAALMRAGAGAVCPKFHFDEIGAVLERLTLGRDACGGAAPAPQT